MVQNIYQYRQSASRSSTSAKQLNFSRARKSSTGWNKRSEPYTTVWDIRYSIEHFQFPFVLIFVKRRLKCQASRTFVWNAFIGIECLILKRTRSWVPPVITLMILNVIAWTLHIGRSTLKILFLGVIGPGTNRKLYRLAWLSWKLPQWQRKN